MNKQLDVYVSSSEAEFILGLSNRSLLRLRDNGVFAAGKCWIRKNPLNPKSSLLYNVEACKLALIEATIAAENVNSQD